MSSGHAQFSGVGQGQFLVDVRVAVYNDINNVQKYLYVININWNIYKKHIEEGETYVFPCTLYNVILEMIAGHLMFHRKIFTCIDTAPFNTFIDV